MVLVVLVVLHIYSYNVFTAPVLVVTVYLPLPITIGMYICHHTCTKQPSPFYRIYFFAVPHLHCSRLRLPIFQFPLPLFSHISSAMIIHYRLCLIYLFSIPIILNILCHCFHYSSASLLKSSPHNFPSSKRSS